MGDCIVVASLRGAPTAPASRPADLPVDLIVDWSLPDSWLESTTSRLGSLRAG